MLEEINRMVCDICSDFLFVYHENYKHKLAKENIENNVYVVGNTIVEVVEKFKPLEIKLNDKILLDIHRPENFMYKDRLKHIVNYANFVGKKYSLPVYMLNFSRTIKKIEEFNIDLGSINVIDLLPFKSYLSNVYHSKFIISDSGTAQEEPALLNTPVIVPRDFTERPESIENFCSSMLDVNTDSNKTWFDSIDFINNKFKNKDVKWLGKGKTSETIIKILKNEL
jgi:UDP-N-acetylglucosamine 2-epimerase (non-hydrolysing)